ncbi:unnamed protein product, partial [marine sediment metagenome]
SKLGGKINDKTTLHLFTQTVRAVYGSWRSHMYDLWAP